MQTRVGLGVVGSVSATRVLVVCVGLISACGDDGPGTSSDRDSGPAVNMTKSELLEAAADCSMDRYRAFETVARVLSESAEAWAADPSEKTRTAAREAWRDAMTAWEEAELFQIGPAAPAMQPGGQELRNQIYSWPLVSRCLIDEQTVSRAYAEGDFSETRINTRGLAAFEYLAFYEGTDNGCGSFSAINAKGTWDALDDEELAQRKADYAAAVATDVLARATALVQAWEPGGGNFRQQLVTAGKGSTTFETDQAGLNAVSHSMFYVENELKDLKLGVPLGILPGCTEERCPESVEALYSDASIDNIRANLVGFRRLMQGCGEDGAGPGFDDLLTAAGAQDVGDRMIQGVNNTLAELEPLDEPLEEIIENDPETGDQIYAALKQITDLMKTEFVTVLNLELPMASEGDND